MEMRRKANEKWTKTERGRFKKKVDKAKCQKKEKENKRL